MTPDEEVEGLTRWASRSAAADRSRLLLALANVVASDDLSGRPRAQAALDVLLPALALDADLDTRAELTQRLADAAWAPAPLLASLARGPGPIARPLLARSPCLDSDSLVGAAREAGPELQLALARRRSLPAALIDELIARGDPDVLPALAGNPHAAFAPEQLVRLAEAAVHLPALRHPLLRRQDLTAEAAAVLAPHLAPAARADLLRRFGPLPEPAGLEPEAEQMLVRKLQQSGRLTPGFALRSLREGKRGLFARALAGLSDRPEDVIEAALGSEEPAALADVCEAAGLDRSLLPTIRARLADLPVPAAQTLASEPVALQA